MNLAKTSLCHDHGLVAFEISTYYHIQTITAIKIGSSNDHNKTPFIQKNLKQPNYRLSHLNVRKILAALIRGP